MVEDDRGHGTGTPPVSRVEETAPQQPQVLEAHEGAVLDDRSTEQVGDEQPVATSTADDLHQDRRDHSSVDATVHPPVQYRPAEDQGEGAGPVAEDGHARATGVGSATVVDEHAVATPTDEEPAEGVDGTADVPAGELALDDPGAEAAVVGDSPEADDTGGRGASAGERALGPVEAPTAGVASGDLMTLDEQERVADLHPEVDLRTEVAGDFDAVASSPSSAHQPSRFARPLPRILAIANQKGGVGKTTTAVNLGACLATIGYRVLVCDLDPQGNASTGLGLNPHNMETSMYDVILNDLPIEDCIEPSSVRGLFVAPASLDLAGAEIELVPAFSRELRLKRAIGAVIDDYDFVLIDCPPSLGLLTVNGLAAADEVVVPVQCEYYALEGLGQLLRNVDLVQRNLNPSLAVSAIICVMYDARTKLSDQVVADVRAHFGDKVCRNVVPRTVRLSEAPSFGQPIIAFDPTSRGAIAYRELAKEISGGASQRTR